MTDSLSPSNVSTKEYYIQLYQAAKTNQIDAAKAALTVLGQEALVQMSSKSQKMAPIHFAAARNSTDFVQFCLNIDKAGQIELKEARRSLTPLHLAAMNGHLETCRLLVQQGADLEAKSGREDFEALPCHLAAFYGHCKTLQFLLDQKLGLLVARDSAGHQLLHWAAAGGSLETTELLINRGVPVDLPVDETSKLTPLHIATAAGHYNLARFLLFKGANASAQCSALQQLPAHLAAQFGHVEILQLLSEVDNEFITTAQDGNGLKCIHRAALAGQCGVLAWLLSHKGVYADELTRLGRTPLHLAADRGHVEAVELLLKRGANPYARSNYDDYRYMPIHLAAYNGHLPVVEHFLTFKPDLIDAKNSHGDRPVHVAALTGKTKLVEYLVKKDEALLLEIKNNFGRTPLHCASQEGRLETVKLLIQMGADLIALSDRSDDRRAPIHMAAFNGYWKTVEHFLNVRPDLLDFGDRRGLTPIHTAALKGQIEVVNVLLKRSPRLINQRDNVIGRTPLHYACQEGHLELVKTLLEKGALLDIASDRDDDELLPIHLAAHSGHIQVVDFLLDQVPEMIEATDWLGLKPIHSAALGGQTAMIEYLVKAKRFDVNSQDNRNRRTALHYAAEKGHAETCRALLDFGASLSAQSKEKDFAQTPVHMAAFYGHVDVLKVFKQAEKSILAEAKDLHGNRPLHSACLSGKLEVVDFLLEQDDVGLSVHDDHFGRTPLHCAAEKGHLNLVKHLVTNCGADVTIKSHVTDNEVLPVHLAAYHGHVGVVQFLGRRHSRLLTLKDGNGDTAVDWLRKPNKNRNSEAVTELEQWLIESKHPQQNRSNSSRFRRLASQCKIS